MTITEVVPTAVPATSHTDGDGELYAHIINQWTIRPGLGTVSVADAIILGIEVEALCGYRWIPCRDPERYPVCPACSAALAATK